MFYEVRKLMNQPTPTGVGTTAIFEVVDLRTGEIVTRTWNLSDAQSLCRYKNKYPNDQEATS